MVNNIWLVVSNMNFLSPFHIWDNHPSHWLSYFSRWLKPPTRYGFVIFLYFKCRESFLVLFFFSRSFHGVLSYQGALCLHPAQWFLVLVQCGLHGFSQRARSGRNHMAGHQFGYTNHFFRYTHLCFLFSMRIWGSKSKWIPIFQSIWCSFWQRFELKSFRTAFFFVFWSQQISQDCWWTHWWIQCSRLRCSQNWNLPQAPGEIRTIRLRMGSFTKQL